jgi:hypothetical protein
VANCKRLKSNFFDIVTNLPILIKGVLTREDGNFFIHIFLLLYYQYYYSYWGQYIRKRRIFSTFKLTISTKYSGYCQPLDQKEKGFNRMYMRMGI